MGWIIGLVVVVAFGLGVVVVITKMYNTLVRLKNHFENGFAQIDVQLRRRYDLIPNLVETAKGYMSHERETLEAVIAARSAAMNCLRICTPCARWGPTTRGRRSSAGAIACSPATATCSSTTATV